MNKSILTKEQIMSLINWEKDIFATFEVYSPIFGQSIEVRIFLEFIEGSSQMKKVIDDRTVDIINDFLALDETSLEQIKDLLWKHCVDCFENISYGAEVKPGQTEVEANHDEFGIYNREDAFARSHVEALVIDQDDNFKCRYGFIQCDPAWGTGHGEGIVMQNGKPIAIAESSAYYGTYEEE